MPQKLAGIQASFLQRTHNEVALLLELLGRVQAGDATGLVPLKSLAHKIHGSAAMFDFPAMSDSAGELEDLIEVLEPGDCRGVAECGRRLAREIERRGKP